LFMELPAHRLGLRHIDDLAHGLPSGVLRAGRRGHNLGSQVSDGCPGIKTFSSMTDSPASESRVAVCLQGETARGTCADSVMPIS
jgi:hypothetical protein